MCVTWLEFDKASDAWCLNQTAAIDPVRYLFGYCHTKIANITKDWSRVMYGNTL